MRMNHTLQYMIKQEQKKKEKKRARKNLLLPNPQKKKQWEEANYSHDTSFCVQESQLAP